MKNIIQLSGHCCSYILSLALLNAFTDVLNHFYTGLRKRYFKQWGNNSVMKFSADKLVGLDKISVGENCVLGRNIRLTAWSRFGNQVFTPTISFGNGCVIGCNAHITAINCIVLGNKVLTGRNILITDNAHGDNNSEDKVLYPMDRPLISKGCVVIEDNVWLGDNVCVLPGVTIGKGSVIGANTVVTHSIPPYSIAVGTPAKIVLKDDK